MKPSDLGQHASFDSFEECEQAKRLREAWQQSPPEPHVPDFFDTAVLSDELLLAQVLVADAESRLQRGIDASLEHYLPVVPELASGSEACVQLLLLELMQQADDLSAALAALRSKYGSAFESDIEEAAGFAGAISPGLQAGTRLGKYELREKLGEGSFGQVWRAWDRELERYVALKLFPGGEDVLRQMRKLREEVRAASGISHPNVVSVRSAGRFFQSNVGGNRSWLYIDMELCGDAAPQPDDPKWINIGRALPEVAIVNDTGGNVRPRFTPRQSAKMIVALCRGVQQAHIQRIVHCDIKPGNVLLTPSGRPMLTDFGLSSPDISDGQLSTPRRFTRRHDVHHSTVTVIADGKRVRGAPPYMSPEQARGESLNTLSDVYALGAVMYYLLSGRHPYQSRLQPSGTPQSAVQDIIAQVADASCSPAPLATEMPPRLRRICIQAMQFEPGMRYTSAAEMAEELEAWIQHRPTTRTQPRQPFVELLGLWMRRSSVVAGLSAATLLVLLFGIAGTSWQAIRATRAERTAIQERNTAEQARREADRRGEELRQNLYAAQMVQAGEAANVVGGLGRTRELLEHWARSKPDLRGWEWYYLNGLCHADLLTLRGHAGPVRSVAWHPDGQRLISASSDGALRIWEVQTGRTLATLEGRIGAVNAVAWSPDGSRIAGGGADGVLKIWDSATGAELQRIAAHKGVVHSVAWKPDGMQVASGGADKIVAIFDASNGTKVFELHKHDYPITALTWRPDGRYLASGSAVRSDQPEGVVIWDALTGSETRSIIEGALCLQWSPDGRSLARGGVDWQVKVIEAEDGKRTFEQSQGSHVMSVAWSPDGAQLASTGQSDWTVKIWNVQSQLNTLVLEGHAGPVNSVVWSPDGTLVASGSSDGTVKIWRSSGSARESTARVQPMLLQGHGPRVTTGDTNWVEYLQWRPDGVVLATAARDGFIKIWDPSTAQTVATLDGYSGGLNSAAWNSDGTQMAWASPDRTVKVFDVKERRGLLVLSGHRTGAQSVAWSPDGKWLASADEDGLIKIWDAASGLELRALRAHTTFIKCLAWSPDSTRLASGGHDSKVKVWRGSDGVQLLSLDKHTDLVDSVHWSLDGKRLASGSRDHSIKIWDTTNGALLHDLRDHAERVGGVAWSPDGTRLASGSNDRTIKIWDTHSGRLTMSLSQGTFYIACVAWSPDGMRLAASGRQGRAVIYDAANGYAVAGQPTTSPYSDPPPPTANRRPRQLPGAVINGHGAGVGEPIQR